MLEGNSNKVNVAGKKYGVAKKAKIVSVKAFPGCEGSGSLSTLLGGLDWVYEGHNYVGHSYMNHNYEGLLTLLGNGHTSSACTSVTLDQAVWQVLKDHSAGTATVLSASVGGANRSRATDEVGAPSIVPDFFLGVACAYDPRPFVQGFKRIVEAGITTVVRRYKHMHAHARPPARLHRLRAGCCRKHKRKRLHF